MSSTKRARLELGTDDTYITSIADPSDNLVIIQAENQLAAGLRTRAAMRQASPPGLTLATLPFELFIRCTFYLSSTEIGRLGLTAQYFRAALSSRVDGSLILDRSRDIALCDAYDEQSQTLDLSQKLAQQPDIQMHGYEQYLYQVIATLLRHQNWFRAHIRTLELPLSILYRWDLVPVISKLASILTGCQPLHLHFLLMAALPLPGVTGAQSCQTRIFQHLAALKPIAAEKITIENSTLSTWLPELLCQAINKGLLNRNIRCLIFVQSISAPLYHYSISFPNNPAYRYLVSLDFARSYPATLKLTHLPDTVRHLRINNAVSLAGNAPLIEKLDILYSRTAGLNTIKPLAALKEVLPGLKRIYIETPPEPETHLSLLDAIGNLPLPHSSITFSALHIEQPAQLEKLQTRFHTIYLPKAITFHFYAQEDLGVFARLAQQGMFRQLAGMEYQLDLVYTSPHPFIEAVTHQLKAGKLPQLNQFSLKYQYRPATEVTPFLESPDGRLFLLHNTTPFTLQQLLERESLRSLQDCFTLLEPLMRITVSMYARTEKVKQDAFFTALQQRFEQILTKNQALAEKTYPARQWLLSLEDVHLSLYNAYIQQLLQAGILSSDLYHYRQLLPQAFSQTPFGRHLSKRIQTLLLQAITEKLSETLRPKFAEFGLAIRPALVGTTGFSLDFSKKSSVP